MNLVLGWIAALVIAVQASGVWAQDGVRLHTVAPGETLWTIAQLTVGDPTLWPALYSANRDQIKDPARVYPGQRLAIPEIDPERRDAVRREALDINQP